MKRTLSDHAKLMLRTVAGASMAAHGAQKLFGAFGGGGPEATGAAFEEHMHLEPGKQMAMLAGSAEFGSGIATALGVGGPIGPTTMATTMVVASAAGHRGKPYFAQFGGPEAALLHAAIATYLAMAGFGRDSIDAAFGIRVPRALAGAYAAVSSAFAGVLIKRAWRLQDEAAAVSPQPAMASAPPLRRASGE